VHLNLEEDRIAEEIANQINNLLNKSDRISIAAMSRLIWGLLEKERKQNDN